MAVSRAKGVARAIPFLAVEPCELLERHKALGMTQVDQSWVLF